MTSKFYFRPARGEHIYTEITQEADTRCAFCGRVLDGRGNAVPEVVALLFPGETGDFRLLARSCTDEEGYFMFGPLESEALYLIRLYKNDLKLRELEIRTD